MSDVRVSKRAATFALLAERGFKASEHRAGRRSFDGLLHTRKKAVSTRITISDWDFVKYPTIRVLNHVNVLPSLSPHVSGDGSLCYFASGTVVLDRYDPAESIAQCLDGAKQVLDRILHDPQYRHDDVADEFLQHWAHGVSKRLFRVMLGTVDRKTLRSNYWLIGSGDQAQAVISDQKEEVVALARALGLESPQQTNCPCWLFHCDSHPAVPEAMPTNVDQLFRWLREWDRDLYKRVQRVLEAEKDYLKYKQATFAIHSPVGWLGFGFALHTIHRQGAKENPKLFLQWLHKHAKTTDLDRKRPIFAVLD